MKKLKTVTELTNTEDGHNKIWRATIQKGENGQNNGGILCEWGRADANHLQWKFFPGEGEDFVNKKVQEKIKKGYELTE